MARLDERDKMHNIKQRIQDRQKIRAGTAITNAKHPLSEAGGLKITTLLLIGESLDDYIEHRMETDKVLEGILKDIQGSLADINLRQEVEGTIADPKSTEPADEK